MVMPSSTGSWCTTATFSRNHSLSSVRTSRPSSSTDPASASYMRCISSTTAVLPLCRAPTIPVIDPAAIVSEKLCRSGPARGSRAPPPPPPPPARPLCAAHGVVKRHVTQLDAPLDAIGHLPPRACRRALRRPLDQAHHMLRGY